MKEFFEAYKRVSEKHGGVPAYGLLQEEFRGPSQQFELHMREVKARGWVILAGYATFVCLTIRGYKEFTKYVQSEPEQDQDVASLQGSLQL